MFGHNPLSAVNRFHVDAISKFPQTTRKPFEETPHRTLFVWNSIINYYCKKKQYHESLHVFRHVFSFGKPDHCTISIALTACVKVKARYLGKIIHSFGKKNGQVDLNLFTGSGLIEMYSNLGEIGEAMRVFEEYSKPDIVLWTTMITGYVQNGAPRDALNFFSRMVNDQGFLPDSITLVTVASAGVQLFDLNSSQSVHCYALKLGFKSCLSLLNALLNLYVKTGCLNHAVQLFIEMEEKDIFSWASMISCYAHNGNAEKALELFDETVTRYSNYNAAILISALQACEVTCSLERGMRIHELASRRGLELDMFVSTALIDMYMSCSSPYKAIEIFERMHDKDALCYSSLLCGCVKNGMFYKAIGVFCEMVVVGLRPDAVSIVKVLTSCSESGVLFQTSCVHGFALRIGLDHEYFVCASLIEAYAKCGSLDCSAAVFKEIKDRDIVIWSSMFESYGLHGKGLEALELFNQMIRYSSTRPNSTSFLSILSGCSHAGLAEKGIQVFSMMVNEYQLAPNTKHYGALVDLLGRMGDLENVMKFINQMPDPVRVNVWGALLGASRIHQNIVIGQVAAKKLAQLDPYHAGYYILLSNIYAVNGNWDRAAKYRENVKQKMLDKVSGLSVIELRDEVHSFIANDKSHRDAWQIYILLTKLVGIMKEECNLDTLERCEVG